MTTKNIFLLDGAGALLSALLLGVVLVRFQTCFGIPTPTLYFLATCPFFFAIFDGYCYFVSPKNDAQHLKIIACLNAGYCLLSISLALYHFELLTNLGKLYLASEVALVMLLARWEWKRAKMLA